MTSAEIRQKFIGFFINKNHTVVKSAPVVPMDDPTLLFINAGMNQFKDVFVGNGTRPYSRAVDSQKCIRVSGKHNDLEEVGPSPNHHTFFEMLGNWSFGDYYKAEAIRWAWEFLTVEMGLEKDKLYATVFTDDDEAEELWKSETDINPSHISRHGHKDNFWEMGEVGPCGPCSELHYDLGEPAPGCPELENDGPNTESNRFIEIWNLVFIQYRRDENGELHDLPSKHVDTGAGLERICRLMQGVGSNYETDLFKPLIDYVADKTGVPYVFPKEGVPEKSYIPHRAIADHLRSLTFAIADGALPGNEGRGYVLRRILRRAARFIRELGVDGAFLADMVPILIETMGNHYEEIKKRQQHIETVIRSEEEAFGRTLDKGLALFKVISKDGHISGEEAFKLYDTFGFPLDLTEQMARENGVTVDVDGFHTAMNAAKEKSRSASKFVAAAGEYEFIEEGDHSSFTGYTDLKNRTKVKMYRRLPSESSKDKFPRYAVVLEKTPFYAESGGQDPDYGTIRGSELHLDVYDVRQDGDARVHYCLAKRVPVKGKEWPDQVEAKVDESRRIKILAHHTTTHLLQAAFRNILGDHVSQAGSHVTPDYMTFDFTHFEKVTDEQIQEAENIVNENIRANFPVTSNTMDLEEAKANGATALFGEKYDDSVRVITIGNETGEPASMELCGGTHLKRTGEAGLFRIESETGVSAGVRRVECTAGEAAYQRSVEDRKILFKVTDMVGSHGSDPSEKLERLIEKQKAQYKEIENLKKAALNDNTNLLADWGEEVEYKGEKILLVSSEYSLATDKNSLQDVADKIHELLKKENRDGIGVVGALIDKTFMFVAVITKDLMDKGVHAGKLVGTVAKKAGGGGGGKPSFATAGSKQVDKARSILNDRIQIRSVVEDYLKG